MAIVKCGDCRSSRSRSSSTALTALGCLQRLIGWLQQAGYGNLYIIDNASTYPPLLEYLTWLQNGRATVMRLKKNAGPRVLWRQKLLDRLGIETEYVYTDPDVVPSEECPHDLVGKLQSVLNDHPNVAAAGVGLRLDDLPDTYAHKAAAIAWESQFWLRPAGPGLFYAPIDTTFALYRPGGARRKCGSSMSVPAGHMSRRTRGGTEQRSALRRGFVLQAPPPRLASRIGLDQLASMAEERVAS